VKGRHTNGKKRVTHDNDGNLNIRPVIIFVN
jgi:hypothetical protein